MARMKSGWPAQKVLAGSVGAAVATVLVYFIEALVGAPLPETVVGAIHVITVFAFGYFMPPAERDDIIHEPPTDGAAS